MGEEQPRDHFGRLSLPLWGDPCSSTASVSSIDGHTEPQTSGPWGLELAAWVQPWQGLVGGCVEISDETAKEKGASGAGLFPFCDSSKA